MIYRVGQKVPNFMGQDGLFLKLSDSGILLLCRMNRPTSEEQKAGSSCTAAGSLTR